MSFDLKQYGISVDSIARNASVPTFYEVALQNEKGSFIANNGALVVDSGEKKGRIPKDKRIVRHSDSENDICWGEINIELDQNVFDINYQRAIDFLNTRERLFVVDGYAGWDEECKLKVRVICARAYHGLFMTNMLRRLSPEELDSFGEPDFVIFNAGQFPANRFTQQMTSPSSVDINFERKQMVILGTEYAGELKKGIFTVMNYLMPKRGVLSMHCSANEGTSGDVSLFFGLSGTGKTTLSADQSRALVGDDEHCWSDRGIFNIEGGCYAKCIGLSEDKEPEIFKAIRFGSLLENVAVDPITRIVDYNDSSFTENTRASYPIEFIPNAKIPCSAGHPTNVIFLTCDAFGVLPPVSRLTPAQAMYHFISGYTAKIAGTEVGVTEPEATFSACYGAAFLVWHPSKYAELLAAKMTKHGANAWLVNTGWSGGIYGEGERISLKHTRAIVDAINAGALVGSETKQDPIFGLQIPTAVPNVPSEVLFPRSTWNKTEKFDQTARKLAELFIENFRKFEEGSSKEIKSAGPKI